jgi:ketosteroid isomerase-like protein
MSFEGKMTVERLQAFAEAFNQHDADAVMRFMTDDCVFVLSWGPEIHGARFEGRDAVCAGFLAVWETYPDGQWSQPHHFVTGDRGVTEWIFTGTRAHGTRVEVNGCDVFTFRGDRILVKDSYRKIRE